MSSGAEFIKRITGRILKASLSNTSSGPGAGATSADGLAKLSPNLQTCSDNLGTTHNLVVAGNPAQIDSVVYDIAGNAITVNDFFPQYAMIGRGKGFLILSHFDFILGTTYFLKMFGGQNLYPIPAHSIVGVDSTFSIDVIKSSENGRDILIGTSKSLNGGTQKQLNWAILKNFGVNTETIELTYILETGGYLIDSASLDIAVLPPQPSLPPTMNGSYSYTMNTPPSSGSGTIGFVNGSGNRTTTWEAESDPQILPIEQPTPVITLSGLWVFSTNSLGVSIVDYIGSFSSTFQNLLIYRMSDQSGSDNWTFRRCNSGAGPPPCIECTRTNTWDYAYNWGSLSYPYVCTDGGGVHTSSSPCTGFHIVAGSCNGITQVFNNTASCSSSVVTSGDISACVEGEGDYPILGCNETPNDLFSPIPYGETFPPYICSIGLIPLRYQLINENVQKGLFTLENLNLTPAFNQLVTYKMVGTQTAIVNSVTSPFFGFLPGYTVSTTADVCTVTTNSVVNTDLDIYTYFEGFKSQLSNSAAIAEGSGGRSYYLKPYLNKFSLITGTFSIFTDKIAPQLPSVSDTLRSNDSYNFVGVAGTLTLHKYVYNTSTNLLVKSGTLTDSSPINLTSYSKIDWNFL